MNGTIYNHWVNELLRNHNCYLNTDEVQMIMVAVLLCNNLINRHVHVLSPQSCQKIMDAYNSIGEDGDQENLRKALHTIHKYLDCTQDIMEHRYLAFLFNTGSYHWVFCQQLGNKMHPLMKVIVWIHNMPGFPFVFHQ